MQLKDFNTIQEAREYSYKVYRKIGGNEARQFFGIMGVLDGLEANKDSTTVVEVIPNIPTTIGAICRTVLQTMLNGKFATDPATQDGSLNRAAANILVQNNIFSDELNTEFFSRAVSTIFPFENQSEYDFKHAKGLPISKKGVTPNNGWIKITLTRDVEAHRPQVYADIQGVNRRVTGFGLVDKAGDYIAEVPRGYAVFYVDDAYEAIA